MILKSIELKNFRLHKNTALEFSDDLNFIVGGNGQGKTTILEAVYYLCTTKSLNQTADTESVNFDSSGFELNGQFSDITNNRVRMLFDQLSNKKSYFLGDKQIFRTSSIIGKFPVVVLIQSDHAITMGAPTERRKFIDSVISQASETYLKILIEYGKTLRQRSSLLSKIREEGNRMYLPQLEAWTESLVKLGSEIVKHRLKFLNDFDEYIKEAYRNIMEDNETPSIKYSFLDSENIENIEERFNKGLLDKRNDEIRRAANLVGPHRDDFLFLVNNLELRKYGSQGQHKTFQIALRFGQFYYLKDKMGRVPVFLMDDIFGELDTYRAGKISSYLKNIGQAFITMTDFSNIQNLDIAESDKQIRIFNGTAEYVC